MARRELLMQAHVLKPEKHKIGGWYMSEKLDGGRCFWDGGITRGVPTNRVPWAGIISPKTGQPKKKIKPFSTGLWSRYGNPIMAPDWFLNALPCCPLDGELWAGRGNVQKVMSTIRKDKPVDEQWKQIEFSIFGSPDFSVFAQDGEVKNTQQHTNIKGAMHWAMQVAKSRATDWFCLNGSPVFSAELVNINEWINNFIGPIFMIKQIKLPTNNDEAMAMVMEKKIEVISAGGEGLFLRDPQSVWSPHRVYTSLKVKGALDDEGTIVGFTSGRKTDKGSKLLGLIGALVLDYKGHRLELSGLTNEEREFDTIVASDHAEKNPGVQMPDGIQGKMFNLGDKVTFTYRELTDKGIPKDARYMRKRP